MKPIRRSKPRVVIGAVALTIPAHLFATATPALAALSNPTIVLTNIQIPADIRYGPGLIARGDCMESP